MVYDSLVYSIPYVIVLLILFLLSIIELKRIKNFIPDKVLRSFSFLIVLVFLGLRGYVASDWVSYTQFYTDIPAIDSSSFLGYLALPTFEKGFVVFSSIIKIISDNYFVYSFINVLIDLILLNILLKRYCKSYYIFGLTVYFAFCSEYEINMLRNVKAIMLFLLSIKYIQNRSFLKFFLINLAGLLFHNSAIFFFPLYFFIHKNTKRVYIIFTFIGIIIYFFQIHYIGAIANILGGFLGGVFEEKNDVYLKSVESGVTLGVFYTLIPLFLVFRYYDKILQYKKENIIFINLLFLYCFATLYFSEILVFRQRFAALFSFSLCVILPLFYILNKNIVDRKIMSNLLIVVLISKMALTNTPILNKYDNLIFGIQSYEERFNIFQYYIRK